MCRDIDIIWEHFGEKDISQGKIDMAPDVVQLCFIETEKILSRTNSFEKTEPGENEKAILIQYETESIDTPEFQFLDQ